jgi:nucleoid-associated protein YgaU
MFSGAAHAESAPLSPSTIADAARSADMPCVPAVAVAEAESDGVPDAVGPMGELGLWQVYGSAHPSLASLARGTVTEQAEAAATVLDAQGWDGWTTYGGPRYQAALPTARQACARHAGQTSAAQTGTPRHAAPATQRTYTVRAGDCLSTIAARLGLDGWHGLYSANRSKIEDPALIYPGQTLTIPRS